MVDVLDSFTQVMTGNNYFNRYVRLETTILKYFNFVRLSYDRIVYAMSKFDPDLPESQNAAWRGVVEYYESGGGPTDVWGSYPSRLVI